MAWHTPGDRRNGKVRQPGPHPEPAPLAEQIYFKWITIGRWEYSASQYDADGDTEMADYCRFWAARHEADIVKMRALQEKGEA